MVGAAEDNGHNARRTARTHFCGSLVSLYLSLSHSAPYFFLRWLVVALSLASLSRTRPGHSLVTPDQVSPLALTLTSVVKISAP